MDPTSQTDALEPSQDAQIKEQMPEPEHDEPENDFAIDSHRTAPKTLVVLVLFLFSASIILYFTEVWLFKTWAKLSVEEILFHIQAPLAGTNAGMVSDYLLNYGVAEAGCLFVLFLAFLLLKDNHIMFVRLLLCTVLASFGLAGAAIFDFSERTGLVPYLESLGSNKSEDDFIAENYIDPQSVVIEFPERRRNLVYIYLESLEITFADKQSGGAFALNTIPELTDLALSNECFNGDSNQLEGGISYPGTDWTMGAIFAQSTGLPLKVSGITNDTLSHYDSFFDGLIGIGDILEDEGYHQVFLLGSDIVFGGREGYFRTHGNFEIRDYYYALENGLIPEGHHVFWGYEDLYLFEIARQTMLELAAEDEPFNLTILTVDTHFPDGYVCEQCENDFGSDQYSNVMHCSSRQVTELVSWIQSQDFYENTSIIICGDHPTMDSDYCRNVPDDYIRKTFTTIINSANKPKDPDQHRYYSTMDLFPTTLAAIGVSIEGNRLGLGTNLFSNQKTLTESLGYEECASMIARHSSFLTDAFSLGNSERYLDNVAEVVVVDARENDAGTITFSLQNLGAKLNLDSIFSVDMYVTDSRTGERVHYPLFLVHHAPSTSSFSDESDFFFERLTPYPAEDLSYLEVDFCISLEGIDNYSIAHLDGKSHSPESS